MKSNAVFCLMGPTASGKTALALELVRSFPFEIISVDSAMVYRGMDIGTAKPDAAIRRVVPHHLIDICDPVEVYSAAQFRWDALRTIEHIFQKGKIPLLVGGTMLYFKALQQGIADMPSANAMIREQLSQQAACQGWIAMHQQLQCVDPEAAHRIHPHDSQRIQRALEVYMISGKNLTEWQKESTETLGFPIHNLIIVPDDRAILHQRIADRFHAMLNLGLVDEVRNLFNREDLSLNTPAIRSVGYRQVWLYLEGQYTFTEMQEKGIIATRQLAKRQLTWLRYWPDAHYFDSESDNLVDEMKDSLQKLMST